MLALKKENTAKTRLHTASDTLSGAGSCLKSSILSLW